MTSKTRSIDICVDIVAPRERVWDALTREQEIPRWFAPVATVSPGLGGYIEVSWGEGMTGRNNIAVWQPFERLVCVGGDETQPLQESYSLDQQNETTRLSLEHSGFSSAPEADDQYDAISNGWRAFFRMLEHGVSRHAGRPFKNVSAFSPLAMRRDRAWAHVVAPGGLTRDGMSPQSEGQPIEMVLTSGQKVSGVVLHSVWPGYLIVDAKTHDDSLLALFCERNGEESLLTLTWILNGDAIELETQIRAESTGWVEAARGWKAQHVDVPPAGEFSGSQPAVAKS